MFSLYKVKPNCVVFRFRAFKVPFSLCVYHVPLSCNVLSSLLVCSSLLSLPLLSCNALSRSDLFCCALLSPLYSSPLCPPYSFPFLSFPLLPSLTNSFIIVLFYVVNNCGTWSVHHGSMGYQGRWMMDGMGWSGMIAYCSLYCSLCILIK